MKKKVGKNRQRLGRMRVPAIIVSSDPTKYNLRGNFRGQAAYPTGVRSDQNAAFAERFVPVEGDSQPQILRRDPGFAVLDGQEQVVDREAHSSEVDEVGARLEAMAPVVAAGDQPRP
ncbi:hypothetical protein [Pelagovum pacificum]|uniref:Uncharacterized protein n=1 Tax=Pelagovum pacificum TaxID=2588711 RepID=A0A5C5GE51_9RHOB|nr:hypothetical protein [Pelagovum pacificum]TNY32474.1 hypothetical protein FHY64_04065 [Pelagovum pacificum]